MSDHRRRLLSQTRLAGVTAPRLPPNASVASQQLLRGMLKGLGDSIRETMGVAMAASMLNKPQAEVTRAEALAAFMTARTIPDPIEQARIVREGLRAMLSKLAGDVIPMAYANELVTDLERLDDGDIDGLRLLTPSIAEGPASGQF